MPICNCGQTYDDKRASPTWQAKEGLPPLSVYMCPTCERKKRDQVKARKTREAGKKAAKRWPESK